jgi:hypothetical protein
MSASGRPSDWGRIAVVADLVITGLFTAFLLAATDSHGDAVPRPVALAAFYASTAVVGWLGVIRGRRSLLVAAALPLFPGAVLSFSGVTLIFLIPAFLFVAAAVAIPASARSWPSQALGLGLALTIPSLIIAAGWAVLFGLSEERCFTTSDGSGCGSGLISVTGVSVELSLIGLAIAIAALAAKGRPPAPDE